MTRPTRAPGGSAGAARLVASAALLAAPSGCDSELERMIDQPRFASYEPCEVCPDGTSMLQPPAGTVAREAEVGPSELVQGRTAAGAYVDRSPVPLDGGLLVRGRDRFNTYCAACHGRLGNGVSKVAENMTLRKPANLLGPPYPGYPPGRLFTVITEGYGLMRSYAEELPVPDRWAVVAYVQALQLSQHVALDALPPSIREEARRWLK
ncbi:MAG TPA: cytochrome c [Kofleriaceae bacterium]|nr:cytochrome c [Kofleriaceae bacterium]